MIPLVLPLIDKALDLIFPDKTERDQHRAKLAELALQGELQSVQNEFELLQGQIRIAEKEAGHSDIFVSGWRPFVGWICAGAFAWAYILRDFFILLASFTGSPIDAELLPKPDLSEMLPILIGMLGLGGMRSVERINRVQRNKL